MKKLAEEISALRAVQLPGGVLRVLHFCARVDADHRVHEVHHRRRRTRPSSPTCQELQVFQVTQHLGFTSTLEVKRDWTPSRRPLGHSRSSMILRPLFALVKAQCQ